MEPLIAKTGDATDTLPINIMDLETPPRSCPRTSSPARDVQELRENYQSAKEPREKRPRPSPPRHCPYTPEVEDSKARGSDEAFTHDDEVLK